MDWLLVFLSGCLLIIVWMMGGLIWLARRKMLAEQHIWRPWNEAIAAQDWEASEMYRRRCDQAIKDISIMNPWMWWKKWNTTWEEIA